MKTQLKVNIFMIAVGGILGTHSSDIFAQELSPVSLFQRCYGKITQNVADVNSTMVKQVRAAQVDPIDACLQIFDKGRFVNAGKISNTGDQEAINVVNTMNNVHFSWFTNKANLDFSDYAGYHYRNHVDITEPALTITQFLFTPNKNFGDIFIGNQPVRAKRSKGQSYNAFYKSYTAKGTYNLDTRDVFTSRRFLETGKLIGVINDTKNYTLNYDCGTCSGTTGSIAINRHFGGGVIGSNAYVTVNTSATTRDPRYNGAGFVNRQWAENVLHDFTCRELPVVRESDAKAFVVNDSTAMTFRQSAGCTKCHVTHDRLAGVARGVNYPRVGTFREVGNVYFAQPRSVSAADANIFPAKNDGSFYKRPAKGHFYFREYNGTLVDRPLNNMEAAGGVLKSINAPYICMAKRYYEYFTGINADIGDIGDPDHPVLTPQEKKYRDIVINLGLQLKQHQSLRTLVGDILNRKEFRYKDYGVRSLANE